MKSVYSDFSLSSKLSYTHNTYTHIDFSLFIKVVDNWRTVWMCVVRDGNFKNETESKLIISNGAIVIEIKKKISIARSFDFDLMNSDNILIGSTINVIIITFPFNTYEYIHLC